jgi:hypothetical protein
MRAGLTILAAMMACVLAGFGRGTADDPGSKVIAMEIEVTVSGELKSRPSNAEPKAAWESVRTPAKVTIKPGQVYAFDMARDVSDEQLVGLKSLRDVPLRDLTVSSSRMSDAGLEQVAQLSGVHYLYLSACDKITDKGLAHLKKMPSLERLWVTANSSITDEGIKSLAEIKKLNWLSLFGCKRVSDEGTRALKSASNLTFVFLRGTAVTEAGVAELKTALPKCEVSR